MGGTSSARPDELNTFVTKANAITDDLQTWVTKLSAALNSFQASGSVGTLESGAIQAVPGLLQKQRINALFVDVVREAFLTADTGSSASGVVSVSDSALQDAFVKAAQNRGLDPNLLSQIGPPLSVPPTTSGAIPQDSGFVDDPVCTATGHFLEEEHDVVVPDRLAVLSASRWYSSRLLDDRPSAGEPSSRPFGRGWWSWASVRCAPAPDGRLTYRGPDGRSFELVPTDGDRWARADGLEATVHVVDGAVEVTWDTNARFSSQRWRFDGDGRLTTVWGPTLGTTAVRHDGGRLVELRHDGGRTLTYEWSELDGADRIVGVHLSDGRSVTYEYDERGDLAAVRRATGDRQYRSDELGRIVSVYDADDVRLCFNTYDDDGRVLVQISPLGRETVFQYLAGRLTRVSDTAGGPVSVFEHDAIGRVVGLVDADGHRFSRTFGPGGQVLEQRSFDGSTMQRSSDVDDTTSATLVSGDVEERWAYDERGRVIEHERPGGRLLRYRYDGSSTLPSEIAGPLGWSMRHEWDEGIPVSITDADGVGVRFAHDGAGNLTETVDALGARTTYEWHATGRPAVVRHPDGAEQRLVWDDGGRLVALVDPAGNEIGFEHSPAGRLRALTDQEGARTEIVYGEHGFAIATIDPLGRTTEWRRDQFEHLVGLTNPDGAKWELAYSHLGQLSLISGPDGSTWSSVLDAEGRLTELVDPLGGSRSVTYDSSGRAIEVRDELGAVTTSAYDEVGNLTEVVDPLGGVTRQAWDALDRLTSVTDADGVAQAITYTPAGRVSSLSDALGNETTFEHDAVGRTIAMIDPTGGTWRTGYDAVGRVVSTTTASGITRTWTYAASGVVDSISVGEATWAWRHDRCGRVVAAVDPLGATVRYRYDAAGRLVAASDALNHRTEYRYDEMGHVVATVDPFGREVTTTWDVMGRPVETIDQLGRSLQTAFDRNGQLVRTVDGNGSVIERTRDARGDVLALLVDGVEAVRFERDASGRTVGLHESGRSQTFETSPAGRLQSATNAARVLRYRYDAAGRLVGRSGSLGNGDVELDETYELDGQGRVASVRADRFGTVVFTRDADGRAQRLQTDWIERSWRHDEQGRLVGYEQRVGTGASTTALTRDLAGHVVAAVTDGNATTYRYDDAGQLVAVGGGASSTFTFDEAGRLTTETGARGTSTYEYDAAHQLMAVDSPAGRTTFTYDGVGQRLASTGPNGGRTFTWDGLQRLTAIDGTPVRVDATGRLDAVGTTELWWDPTSPLGAPLTIGDDRIGSFGGHVVGTADLTADDPDVTWHAADWRGSVADRDAWGRAPGGSTGSGEVALGFLGEVELDGLVWLRARLYDPATASFLSPDPLPPVPGSPVAANPYHYGGNDPLGMVDPLGLRPVSIDDYNAARDAATGVQWGNIAKVAVIVGGVALTIACPALGPVALGLLGAGMGAAPGVIDGITTGHWDAGAIVKGAVVGGVVGVASAYLPGATTLVGAGTSTAARVGINVGVGAGVGAGAGTVNELYDLTGLPGADGRFDASSVAYGAVAGGVGGGLTTGVQIARNTHIVDPAEIRFSQSSVNGADDITTSMGARGWRGKPIDAVRMPDGELTTVDNTRVVSSRGASIDAKVRIHDASDALPGNQVERFTTKRGGEPSTWGGAVDNRIGKQSATFRNTYPSGSPDLPRAN